MCCGVLRCVAVCCSILSLLIDAITIYRQGYHTEVWERSPPVRVREGRPDYKDGRGGGARDRDGWDARMEAREGRDGRDGRDRGGRDSHVGDKGGGREWAGGMRGSDGSGRSALPSSAPAEKAVVKAEAALDEDGDM